MDTMIAVASELEVDGPRSLLKWFVADAELHGRARLVPADVDPGALGSLEQLLAVTVAPGGVATAVASATVAWIRRRVGDVSITLTRPDGASMSFTVKNVRGLDEASVQRLIAQAADWLNGAESAGGDGGEPDGA